MKDHNKPSKPNEDDKWLKHAVKAFVTEDIAEMLRSGEIVIVRTEPDGARIYQKAAPAH